MRKILEELHAIFTIKNEEIRDRIIRRWSMGLNTNERLAVMEYATNAVKYIEDALKELFEEGTEPE